ncbi:MAG: DUF6691 family protein [Halieaceae bacterium]|nr:DUF6691 family protein [Halieaceae bacterium]
MNALLGLIGGLIFGFGLALSGMTDTNKVLGFLDITGAWQPALIFVMGSAVAVTAVAFRFVLRREQPLFDADFHLPIKRAVDGRLLFGAAVFGIGWGIYGYCPGPALTALIYGQTDSFLFVAAMLAGMAISSRLTR